MKNLFYVFCVSFLKIQFANKLFAFLTLLLLLLPQYACNTTEPPSNQTLTLKLEDVSCTEAWLQLTTTNIQIPNNISLLINGIVKKTLTLNTQDSLLYIDSLLPNQNYSFQVSSIQNPVSSISSNKVSSTTLDTTSHNFTWQTFTFGGQAGSCALYDVAIIDENNIWAVGEIYMLDSLGNPDPACYNVVHWDGRRWELIKIGGYGGWACHTIFAFSTNDIWFEGNIHWDGSKYTAYMNGWPLMPNGDGWQVNKMWGTSSSDLYAVGNNGNIAHYDGRSWQRIESGTDLPIRDIWGVFNKKTNNYEILAVANSYGSTEGSKILSIKNEYVYELWNDNLPYGLDAVWFVPNRRYIAVGDGLWETRIPDTNWVRQSILPALHKTSIRGQSLNDIVVGGAFLLFAHYNGISWQTYFPMTSGSFTSVKIKDNILFAVGGVDGKAIVIAGRR